MKEFHDLVKTCQRAYDDIKMLREDVPPALVVVGSGGPKASTLLGHFAKESWTLDEKPIHEILIVAEHLNRSAEEIFTTLLHEAVHGIANTRNIKDVSGRRHNRKFAAICVEVGMEPPEKAHPSLGFSAATLMPESLEFYERQISDIREHLILCRNLRLTLDKDKKKTSWDAFCDCGRKVKLGKRFIEDTGADNIHMKCGLCDTDFVLEDYDG